MMILLVVSSKDPASTNIAKHILQHHPFTKTDTTFQENPVYSAETNQKKITFITLQGEAVYAQNLAEHFADAELIVFISRHSSQSGTPTLSVHTPGNLGEAKLGGLPGTVSVSPANAMRAALQALSRLKQEMRLDYEVSYECTHHGPSLNAPTMFVELGSSPKQWSDQAAADAVAQATLDAIANFGNSKGTAVLGIGGTHYNEKFTKMALDSEAVFGHMVPKYAVSLVTADLLRQCVEKTLEKVECAFLDWKGIRSEDKPKLLSALQEIGLPYKKV